MTAMGRHEYLRAIYDRYRRSSTEMKGKILDEFCRVCDCHRKHAIPIKTDHWDVTRPGFTEIDLVSHSGECADGEFAHSFNLTDIYTAWTETRAVLGKGETGIVAALEEMRQALPFPLQGIDSDNGSEFLNHHLVRYCRAGQIQFTRAGPTRRTT